MTRGIYLSQQIAREIGVRPGSKYPDLLFDERNSLTSNISGELHAMSQHTWTKLAMSMDVLLCYLYFSLESSMRLVNQCYRARPA